MAFHTLKILRKYAQIYQFFSITSRFIVVYFCPYTGLLEVTRAERLWLPRDLFILAQNRRRKPTLMSKVVDT